MKVVILAGGLGTRLSEETSIKPKPMVEIGNEPILWHIMKIYSFNGFDEFVILAGYKQEVIKKYFESYVLSHSNIDVNFKNNSVEVFNKPREEWNVKIVDTGQLTMTGGRIKQAQKVIGSDTFLLTYGDGLSDVNMRNLLSFHNRRGYGVTATAVQPIGRFGALDIDDDGKVKGFTEKPKGDRMWINGGYYVMEQEIFDYIPSDDTILEDSPMKELTKNGRLGAYKHYGFWKAMDTMTDKRQLERMWSEGSAPWKLWKG